MLVKGLTHRLDDTTLTAEAEYSIDFSEQGKIMFQKKFKCIIMRWIVNVAEIYKFRQKVLI